jgi:hypothetical protein
VVRVRCVSDAVIEVPSVVARKSQQYGLDGCLTGLPDLVAELAEHWALVVDGVLDGGTGRRGGRR